MSIWVSYFRFCQWGAQLRREHANNAKNCIYARKTPVCLTLNSCSSHPSDQLVTITTVDPPLRARIVGITEHGLLRALPERGGGIAGRYGAGSARGGEFLTREAFFERLAELP